MEPVPNIWIGLMLRKMMNVLSLFTPSRTHLGVVEVAELLQRPKSTVSRWLSTMEAEGLLQRDPETKLYRLGMRLAALGTLARQSTSLQRHARPILRWLTEATGETSILAKLTGTTAMNVEASESPRPLRHVGQLGRNIPLHASAAGKSLLAWRTEPEMRALVGEALQPFTSNTITDFETLLSELDVVRRRGYSISRGEFEADIAAVGAPVREAGAQITAVVTVAAPLARLPKGAMPEVAVHVVEAASNLSTTMGHDL